MRLLIHACCAPCSLTAIRRFAGDETCYVYYNPNIHPFREYRSRLDAWLGLMEEEGLPHLSLDYQPEEWMRTVAGREERRCELCYELRLGRMAEVAASEAYEALTTTLFSSPYQNHGWLKREGERAAAAAGIRFITWDGSPEYRQTWQEAKRRGLYTQSYCGCLLSERERYDPTLRKPRA